MPAKRLNLGCGATKIEGFINIDVEPSCKPDVVCNFMEKIPYRTGTIDEVILFHTIEHINKVFHVKVLGEIFRVLKVGSPLLISYPEFTKCVENWKTNYKGKKAYWEATIFGRGLYLSDFHVCIMHTPDFIKVLESCGFTNIIHKAEQPDSFNTIVSCQKGAAVPNYEDLMQKDMDSLKLVRT